MDQRELLQYIPTKEDFEAYIEKSFREDINALQQTATQRSACMDNVEALCTATTTWLLFVETQLQGALPHLAQLQLQIEGLKDCNQ